MYMKYLYIGKAEDGNYWYIQKNFLKYVHPKTRKSRIYTKITNLTLETWRKLPPKVKKTLEELGIKPRQVEKLESTLEETVNQLREVVRNVEPVNNLYMIRDVLDQVFKQLADLYYTVVKIVNELRKRPTRKRVEKARQVLIQTLRKVKQELNQAYKQVVSEVNERVREALVDELKTWNPRLEKYVPLRSPIYKLWRTLKTVTSEVANELNNVNNKLLNIEYMLTTTLRTL